MSQLHHDDIVSMLINFDLEHLNNSESNFDDTYNDLDYTTLNTLGRY